MAPTDLVIELLVALLILIGAAFTLLGSLALMRLRDFYSRLHGPTKATTLGVGGLLLASAVFFSRHDGSPSVHEILVLVFLFITAPVSAHLLAKAALHQRTRSESGQPDEALVDGELPAHPEARAEGHRED